MYLMSKMYLIFMNSMFTIVFLFFILKKGSKHLGNGHKGV